MHLGEVDVGVGLTVLKRKKNLVAIEMILQQKQEIKKHKEKESSPCFPYFKFYT